MRVDADQFTGLRQSRSSAADDRHLPAVLFEKFDLAQSVVCFDTHISIFYAKRQVGGDRDDMPYRTNADLPHPLRTHLRPHAQDIYREAFNHAYAAHLNDPRRAESSHRIA
jgi:cation transport regulator